MIHLQVRAKSKLERKSMEVGVVIDIQTKNISINLIDKLNKRMFHLSSDSKLPISSGKNER